LLLGHFKYIKQKWNVVGIASKPFKFLGQKFGIHLGFRML